VLRFAIQFCDGMTHALAKGIKAHRDIKPQNCLITQDYTLKVTDFGLAKVFDDANTADWRGESAGEEEKGRGGLFGRLFGRRQASSKGGTDTPNVQGLSIGLSRTGIAAGTCTHMAPEQFDDAKHVDVRADVYAFGVMLFQMITGKLPFVGRTWQEFKHLHQTQAPLPLPNSLLPSLITVVHSCLTKDPARRFADFSTVREQLTEIYQGLTGVHAPQPVVGAALDAAGWTNKGVDLDNLGRPEEALACHDHALILNPHLTQAWHNKGTTLNSLGRPEEALVCQDHALALNPRYARAWTSKGVTLVELGRPEEALACHDHALALDPRDALAWSSKGVTLRALGRHEEALTCYDHTLALDPRDANGWFNKGVAFGYSQRYREALACFEEAQKLGHPKAAQPIALLRQQLGG